MTDEICQVFLASQLQPAAATPDVTEEFEVLRCAPRQLDAWIESRRVWDGMTLASWMLARRRVFELLGE